MSNIISFPDKRTPPPSNGGTPPPNINDINFRLGKLETKVGMLIWAISLFSIGVFAAIGYLVNKIDFLIMNLIT